MDFAWTLPQFQALRQWSKDEVFDAIAQHRKALESGPEDQPAYPDLRTPEWEVFSAPVSPEATDDFTLRRDPQGVPAALAGFLGGRCRLLGMTVILARTTKPGAGMWAEAVVWARSVERSTGTERRRWAL